MEWQAFKNGNWLSTIVDSEQLSLTSTLYMDGALVEWIANFGECFEQNPLEHVQYLEWQERRGGTVITRAVLKDES